MESKKQKILIVDDETDMRKIIADILTDAGYEPFMAGDGLEGLETAKTVSPDLILSDIQMPSLNGYELLQEVKKDSKLATIPFVFMTGVNIGQKDLRKGMELGADDYLTKPFTAEKLLSAIESRLRKRQRWQQFFDSNLEKTHSDFFLLLSTDLYFLVMDIIENTQSLLTEKNLSNEEVRRIAQVIITSGKRLNRLHENIFFYSLLKVWIMDKEKIASLRQESIESYLSILHSVVRENTTAHNRDKALSITCDDAALQISPVDFGKIMEVVIDNACKYSTPGSSISLSSTDDPENVHVSIRNEGPGMSKQDIAGIISLLDDNRQMARKDGLGLTIAITLAELYGGSLSIKSSPDAGTIVTISLPKMKKS